MINRVLMIIILGLLLVTMVVGYLMLGYSVRDLIDSRTDTQKAIAVEGQEDIDRIAAFVTHTACYTNNKACAGTVVEELTMCAFLGSVTHTKASIKVNFRQAHTFAPDHTSGPYKLILSETAPYYVLYSKHLSWWKRQAADSVMESLRKAGLLKDFQRIRDEMLVPYLESGQDVSLLSEESRKHCHPLVKMIRSDLAGLSDRGWDRDIILSDMKRNFTEEVRVTNEDALQSTPNSGRVYGEPFIFFKKKEEKER